LVTDVFDFITGNGVCTGTPYTYTSKEGNCQSGPKVMAIVDFENVASNKENSLMPSGWTLGGLGLNLQKPNKV
jgi:hypothetical protein